VGGVTGRRDRRCGPSNGEGRPAEECNDGGDDELMISPTIGTVRFTGGWERSGSSLSVKGALGGGGSPGSRGRRLGAALLVCAAVNDWWRDGGAWHGEEQDEVVRSSFRPAASLETAVAAPATTRCRSAKQSRERRLVLLELKVEEMEECSGWWRRTTRRRCLWLLYGSPTATTPASTRRRGRSRCPP
jgi:hypothetical protein